MHLGLLVLLVLYQMHFIPSHLTTQFLRYCQFRDNSVGLCKLQLLGHFLALSGDFANVIDLMMSVCSHNCDIIIVYRCSKSQLLSKNKNL